MEREAADSGVEFRIVARTMVETSVEEFFGWSDSAGHWIDGTLTEVLRSTQKSSKPVWIFVVLGAFDHEMHLKNFCIKIDQMNALFDSNLLCLASGELLSLFEEDREE